METIKILAVLSMFGVFIALGLHYWKRSNISKGIARLGSDQKKVSVKTVDTLGEKMGGLAKFSASDKEIGALSKSLVSAGYRTESAKVVYFSFKTLFALLFPTLFFVSSFVFSLHLDALKSGSIAFALAAFGTFLPNIVLSKMVAKRKDELNANFPDAIDLLRTCVEAGLSTDAALLRVGEEIRIRSTALADELRLVVLEQRAGASRTEALVNMAERIGLPEIESMVSSLVQSEKLGTSLSETLKIFSETLRHDRKVKAEEMAAKIPTKILLPLIVCIFPLLFILILSPPVYNVVTTLKANHAALQQ